MNRILALLTLGGCAIDDRLLIDVPIVAGGAGVAADGLTFDEATVRFADLRLEEPATDIAAIVSGLAGFGTAYAHPGHDYPGDVAGELLGTFDVDLLGPEVALGVAPCYEGEFATGRVRALGAAFAGSYEAPDGAVLPFRFEVPADQEIAGIPFDALLVAGNPPTGIALRFDVAGALSQVDWAAPDTDGDGLLTVDDETFGNTAHFGVVATPTWSLTLLP